MHSVVVNVMRTRLLSAVLLLVAFSQFLEARESLPSLKADPAVQEGVLPCGIGYLIAANPSVKGVADIALLQRACQNEITVSQNYPFLQGRSLSDFLSGKGVVPGVKGYAERLGDNVLYHFKDVPVAAGDACLDSLVLTVFRIAEKSSQEYNFLGTSGQTIIIAGDVDKAQVLTKLKLLSLIVPRRNVQIPDSVPTFEATTAVNCEVKGGSSGATRVKIEFKLPCMPKSLRPTVVAHIGNRLGLVFERALASSLGKELSNKRIPCSSLCVTADTRTLFDGYDCYSLQADVLPSDVDAFVASVSSVLSKVFTEGLSYNGFKYVSGCVDDYVSELYSTVDGNKEYIDRCVAHVLYGTDLSSPAQRAQFFRSKDLADSTQIRAVNRFFTNFQKSAQTSITCRGGALTKKNAQHILSVYASYADSSSVSEAGVNLSDTVNLASASDKPYKPSKIRTDSFTGGKQYTYPSGLNVIYKKMATKGRLYFSLVFPDGVSGVDSLRQSEAPFLQDYFNNLSVGALSGDSFRRLMEGCGVRFECSVGASDLVISGTATSAGRLPLILSALVSLSTDSSMVDDSYVYDCQRVFVVSAEAEGQRIRREMDRKLFPDSEFTLFKTEDGLYQDSASRARALFKKALSHYDKAVLFLAGDVNDWEVEKVLRQYVGLFPCSGALNRSDWTPFRIASGTSTISSSGDECMIISRGGCLLPVTAESLLASQIAEMALSRQLAIDLAPHGMTFDLTLRGDLVPQDRFEFDLSLRYPGAKSADLYPRAALKAAQKALSELCDGALTDADFALYRKLLTGQYEAKVKTPQYWEEAVRVRFAYGRDLGSKPLERIKALTKDDVLSVLKGLRDGGCVECIVE